MQTAEMQPPGSSQGCVPLRRRLCDVKRCLQRQGLRLLQAAVESGLLLCSRRSHSRSCAECCQGTGEQCRAAGRMLLPQV